MRQSITSFLLFYFSFFCFGQEKILLKNPSFEDKPRLSHTPNGWYDCGFPGESEVDVHPVPLSEFQVDKVAIDGKTYLGMVTRENDTWEAIAQRLTRPLLAGKAYYFNILLAQSDVYLSKTDIMIESGNLIESATKINFTTPITLQIWGSNSFCEKEELLATSPIIANTEWCDFNFTIKPEITYQYIIFEAFYQTPTLFPYSGNLLLDCASPFIELKDKNAAIIYEHRALYVDSLKKVAIHRSATIEENEEMKKAQSPTGD